MELSTDRPAWKHAQSNGARILNSRFSRQEHGPRLVNRILRLEQRLEEHHLENFTGAMLRHHTAASSRYMSRWIEAKNRQG